MKKFIAILLILTAPAIAQQQVPTEQALGEKLFQEIQIGLNCRANLIGLQAELDKMKARVKELETKMESK